MSPLQSDTAFSGLAALPEADIYSACRDFVCACALPPLDPAAVFQGWQNRAALPAASEDYALISLISASQHGTAIERFCAPDPALPGRLSIEALLKVAVMLEFCGEGDAPRLRAQRCVLLARSSLGAAFFNERGLSSLYADPVREHCFKAETGQFVRRYATALHLSLWTGAAIDSSWFGLASLARLENVDSDHQP